MNLGQAAMAVLLLTLVVVTGSVSYGNATQPYLAENESITLSDSGATVDHADTALAFEDDVTVQYNSSTLSVGDDYLWNDSTGELQRANGSTAPDGSTVAITYQFDARSETTEGVNSTLSALFGVLPYLALFVVGLAVASQL